MLKAWGDFVILTPFLIMCMYLNKGLIRVIIRSTKGGRAYDTGRYKCYECRNKQG